MKIRDAPPQGTATCRGIISCNREKPRNCAGLSLILVMLVCATADPKTPASHPLFCPRVVCEMAWFLTFPCPLLQLRAVSPSRRQLLHFWGDFLFKEPTRLPSSPRSSGTATAIQDQISGDERARPVLVAQQSCLAVRPWRVLVLPVLPSGRPHAGRL